MLNNVCLAGRLTANPDIRRTTSGVPVTTFRLAVDRDFKDKNGDKTADFFSVVCWRATAEFVSKFASKGRIVIVEGRLQNREYTDKDGNRRTVTEIQADNVYFGDSRKDTEPKDDFEEIDDDEIPF